MTIGAGFQCSDGVVLCADRELSFGQDFKDYAQKIYVIDGLNWAAAFAFAGDENLMRLVWDDFCEDLLSSIRNNRPTIKEFKEFLGERLRKTRDEQARSSELNLDLLVGVSTSDERPTLIKGASTAVVDAGSYEFIGMGNSELARYLFGLFGRIPPLKVQQALRFGVYTVSKVKEYVQGCGGGTDAAVIREGGRFDQVPDLDEIEMQNSLVEDAVRYLLLALADPETPKEEFERKLHEFDEKMTKYRSDCRCAI
jgi:20S proteasome alpha/beta subunit